MDADQLNLRVSFWRPDKTIFRLRWWADSDVKRAKEIRYCYWRFGFGPRVCLEKYVVHLIMKTLIVELVKNWDLKLVHERA